MNSIRYILTSCGLALLLSSCASNTNSPAATSAADTSVSSRERAVAERVYSLVNQERTRAGKRAMRPHSALNQLAQKHSNQLGALGKDAHHRGSQNRAQYAYLKHSIENMSEMTFAAPAGSSDPAAMAVSAWKNNPENRRHMLQSWDLTGVGVRVASNGNTYVTICMGAQPMGVPRGVQPVGWQ